MATASREDASRRASISGFLAAAYTSVGLEAPSLVLWVQSPLQGVLAALQLELFLQGTAARVWAPFWHEMGAAVLGRRWMAILERFEERLRKGLGGSSWHGWPCSWSWPSARPGGGLSTEP